MKHGSICRCLRFSAYAVFVKVQGCFVDADTALVLAIPSVLVNKVQRDRQLT
jgi:hypothetical protein